MISPIVDLILFLIISSVFIFTLDSSNSRQIKLVALVTSIIAFFYSLFFIFFFDLSSLSFQYQYVVPWLFGYGGSLFHLGIDGVSLFFIILTTFLVPVCFLASWQSIKVSIKLYSILFLVMEAFLILVFSILDILLFYIFFEAVLIPMFLIIGIWGGSKRRKVKAAYYFFLYTLFGSVLMLLGILSIYLEVGSTHLYSFYAITFSEERQLLLWLSFFVAMAIKIPMFPAHVWLPEAHVEAPTAGSVILAGVLLKMGGYGFLRFLIPFFPYATVYFLPLVYTLAIIGILYASFTTLCQVDMKRIVAYSSVAHMNFVVLGIFSLKQVGVEGAILLMIGHGLVSSALFLLVGVLYDRHHTRLLKYFGGLVTTMPIFSLLFFFFNLANLSFPGTSNFVGEFLIFTGLFQASTAAAVFSGFSIILCVAYSMWFFGRVCFGTLKIQYVKEFFDLNFRDLVIFTPLVCVTIFMGFYPEAFLVFIRASVMRFPEIWTPM